MHTFLLYEVFCHCLQDEKKLREALRFANACGAITTTKKGAIPAMPTEAEALEFLGRV